MSWLTDNLGGLAATIGGVASEVYAPGNPWGIAATAGGLSMIGGQAANRTNQNIAANATSANMLAAREQMQFQQVMSNTAFQRARLDMNAAGINPLLAGGSPESSPAGAMGRAETAQVSNVLGQGVSSAIEARNMMTDLQSKGSQTALNQALASKALIDAQASAANTRMSTLSASALESQLESIAKRARADSRQSDYDYSFGKYDAFARRANRDSGTAKNVMQMFKMPDFFSVQPKGTTLMKNSTGEVLNERN